MPGYATCVQGNHQVEDESVVQPLCPVMRLATENDRRTMEYNRKREKEASDICRREDRRARPGDEAGQRLLQL